jgi:gluconolactonase
MRYVGRAAAVLALGLAASVVVAQDEKPDEKPGAKSESKTETKTVTIKADETQEKGLALSVPANWKQTEPASRLRLAQFEIPAVEGDSEPVELAVFSFAGGGGGVQQNIERWIGQFQAEGRETKVTAGKAGAGQFVLVDVSGTYNKPVGPPIMQKTEPLPDARMLALILGVPEQGVYFLKMAGPQKTVSANRDALRGAIGVQADTEKELSLTPDEKPADGEKPE